MPSQHPCQSCPNIRQSYFDGKMVLPCAWCSREPNVVVALPDGVAGIEMDIWSPLKIAFIRVASISTDTWVWRAEPCLDRTVNAALTAAIVAEGLDGCFVRPAVARQDKIHETRAPYLGQQAANNQQAIGALAKINAQQSAAAQALGLNAGYHMTSLNCMMMGCEICGIADQRGKLTPPAAKDSLPFLGVDRSVRRVGPSGCPNEGPGARPCIGNTRHNGPCCDGGTTWYNPNALPAGSVAEARINEMLISPDGRERVEMVPYDRSIPLTYVPPREPGFETMTETMTAGDVRGGESRRKTPDAVAGCRLGCSCSVHRPVKPAPYIPAIDDFDLLPDA